MKKTEVMVIIPAIKYRESFKIGITILVTLLFSRCKLYLQVYKSVF